MNAKIPNGDDAPLHAILKEWDVSLPLPPRFQEDVWRRIERSDAAPRPDAGLAVRFREWLATRWPRPALAMVYATALVLVGAGAGWRQARYESARIENSLSARYAQAVDPYQGRH